MKPHFSIPNFTVLQNNNILLVHSLEGVVEVYNKMGQIILRNDFYELPPHNEQSIKYSVNNNGVVLLISELQKNSIFRIDSNNKLNLYKNISDGLISGIVSSSNGEIIACSIINWDIDKQINKTMFFNTQNNYSFEFPVRFEKGEINLTNNLFLGISNKEAFTIDILQQEIIWNNSLNNKEIYLDGTFNKDIVIVIQSELPIFIDKEWIYNYTKIISRDLKGKEQVITEINKPMKKIELVKENDNLFLKGNNEIINISVN